MPCFPLLVLALVVARESPPASITAPASVNVTVGRMARFSVKAPGNVKWINLSPDVDLHSPGDGCSVAVVVAKPGTYRIAAIASGPAGMLEPAYVDLATADSVPPPPTPKPPVVPGKLDPAKAIVRLSWTGWRCTATVVGPRRADGRWDILTASHCTEAVGSKGKLLLADGSAVGVTVSARAKGGDLSWMVTDDADLDLYYALLADSDPAMGRKVWHAGYGVDKPGNREDGVVSGPAGPDGKVRFLLSVSSGDSGGGIFDTETGRLVGAVCCTSGMARKATMYGGGAALAAKLRPKSEAFEGDKPWPIPLVDDDGIPRSGE